MSFFDAEQYFDCVNRALHTCGDALQKLEQPRITPENGGWHHWRAIAWAAKFEWPSGERFEIQEYYVRKKQEIFRTFKYQFMDEHGKCIFRFDTHGDEIALGHPCHMHIGDEKFEDDDARLHGFRLTEVDFLLAYGAVHLHLKNKKLPWQ